MLEVHVLDQLLSLCGWVLSERKPMPPMHKSLRELQQRFSVRILHYWTLPGWNNLHALR